MLPRKQSLNVNLCNSYQFTFVSYNNHRASWSITTTRHWFVLLIYYSQYKLCHSIFTFDFIFTCINYETNTDIPLQYLNNKTERKSSFILNCTAAIVNKSFQNRTHSLISMIFPLVFIFHLYSSNALCWMLTDHSESIHIHQSPSVSSLCQVLYDLMIIFNPGRAPTGFRFVLKEMSK